MTTPAKPTESAASSDASRVIWWSVAAAVVTLVLKSLAARLTSSVGFLSDALESGVNLTAALVALWALRLAKRPEDESHAFGYTKAEYLSSGFEAALIMFAAVGIAYAGLSRLLHPQALSLGPVGTSFVIVATAINFFVSRLLARAGKRLHSVALQADAKHLMSDVWTSTAVLVAVFASQLRAFQWLDPLAALSMAVYVAFTGVSIFRHALGGLLDQSLPEADLARVRAVLDQRRTDGVQWHALRTRRSGRRSFISVHLLVPPEWTVQRAHDYVEDLEAALRGLLPHTNVTTHIEPAGDPASFADERLDYDPSRAERR